MKTGVVIATKFVRDGGDHFLGLLGFLVPLASVTLQTQFMKFPSNRLYCLQALSFDGGKATSRESAYLHLRFVSHLVEICFVRIVIGPLKPSCPKSS